MFFGFFKKLFSGLSLGFCRSFAEYEKTLVLLSVYAAFSKKLQEIIGTADGNRRRQDRPPYYSFLRLPLHPAIADRHRWLRC